MAEEQVTALEIRRPAEVALRPRLEWSEAQLTIIHNNYAKGATPEEFALLMEIARALQLDPLKRQIHFVKRTAKDGDRWVDVWATQTGIDGFRSIAEETGLYDGQDEPEYGFVETSNPKTGEILGKRLELARVKVYRKDIGRPFVGVAYFDEFVQVTRDKVPVKMWAEKPRTMLAKCAEALAFRKAFPQKLSKVYVGEELGSDEAPAAHERMSTIERPAAAKPAGNDLEGALREVGEAKTLAQLDALAKRLGAVKWTKAERPVVAGSFDARRKALKPAAKALPCESCGIAGIHADGCPLGPVPDEAPAREPGEEG